MPSDHLIPDTEAFARAATAAARLAAEGRIVVLGIPPTGPSTAYGYIARGDAARRRRPRARPLRREARRRARRRR